MQFIDLKKQYKEIEIDVNERIQKVLNHGKYIMGPEIKELEEKLAEYVGRKYCVCCSSGTDALLMPLMTWGIGTGDAVFTTPFTFIATAEVISLLGATPVFVDIDPCTYNINPEALEKEVKKVIDKGELTPKAILPVDLFGLPADYLAIESIAKKYSLLVLEDAAQGFGGSINGKKACSFGEAASTSFFPAKPLGCYGDGGAVFTDDDDMYQKLISVRVHGQSTDKYENARIGLNARMDSIQAAILLAKMTIFNNEVLQRNKVAELYTKKLMGKVETPTIPDGYISAWAQYSVLAESGKHREEIQSKLKEQEIPTAIYYPKPLHLQSAYKYLNYTDGDFPISEAVSKRIFSLPMHPYLEEEDIDKIAEIV
ncbi:MAG: DegT/DnrJ/EryC1/StrS family aminotransferase [Candidatus Marinimicrobia bacterium]|nr:DegT/DnrJ/EryC1/StrS family aminotransferase [Candidatus Neomarinimicrobiota bacterium]